MKHVGGGFVYFVLAAEDKKKEGKNGRSWVYDFFFW